MENVWEYCNYVTGVLASSFIFSDYSAGNASNDIIVVKDYKGNRPFIIKIKLNDIHEEKD